MSNTNEKNMDGNRSPKEKYLRDFTYQGPEMSVAEARDIMSQFSYDNSTVDLEEGENGIAKVCLNNPRARNAINGKMMIDLNDIIDKLEDHMAEYKGVILYGANGNFCAGGDLKLTKKMHNPDIGYAMSTYIGYVLEKFRNLPMITVAYIDGSGALGGGAEITTACDYRLMSNSSETTAIGFIHGTMGLVPAWGSSGRLMSLVGPRTTLDLLLDGRRLSASEATDVGLVDGTVATLADAVQWLSPKVRHDVNVIRAIKRTRLCHEAGLVSRAASLMERKIFAPLWGGDANRAALDRFFKKGN
ncbi:Crotonase superfamily,ClpP/crotonase-like domain [Cinara cedri]|uniref:Crotonase superfamily,ClpP/crotonase-like domain n=1 Tax=Cinara cedri TaxID=506608 RepID=A0A5E4MHI8_9HEMI|nr:Crotonase superfamily,ClpP/crotonase-like domain [Cinara cedri]